MSKTTEEKIDEMHIAMLELKGKFETFSQMCKMKHEAMDEKVELLDHDMNGNARPGLKEKHQTLEDRFNKIEFRLATVVTVAMFVLQIYGDKIKIFLGV